MGRCTRPRPRPKLQNRWHITNFPPAAGTDGYATITAPGNDPYVITVGAMKTMETPSRTDDLIASYSSKGPTLIDHIVKPDAVCRGMHP